MLVLRGGAGAFACQPATQWARATLGKLKADSTAGEKFQELVTLMARLRAPGGCPWDREQTFDSIKPYTLEETYEVLDAIDRRDWNGLAEELGDFLLQAVFYRSEEHTSGLQSPCNLVCR